MAKIAFYSIDPIAGQRMPVPQPTSSTNGAILRNDGTKPYWTFEMDFFQAQQPSGYFYRTILTRGYTCGGYLSSSPWSQVNVMPFANETMYNIGNVSYTGSYFAGSWSDTNGYGFGMGNAHNTANVNTCSWSFSTNTNRGLNSSWNMTVGRNTHGAMQRDNQYAYIMGNGGGTVTDKFNFATETMGTTTATTATYTCTTIWDQNQGFVCGGTTYGSYLQYATDTWNTWNNKPSTHDGYNKGWPTKMGWGYIREGTNTAGSFGKFSTLSDSKLSTGISSIGGFGEENSIMGQYWGYCSGVYNGAQVVLSYKVAYLQDQFMAMQTAANYPTQTGASSGVGWSASGPQIGVGV